MLSELLRIVSKYIESSEHDEQIGPIPSGLDRRCADDGLHRQTLPVHPPSVFGNCFDKDLNVNAGDLLALFIQERKGSEFMNFGFEFKKGKWTKREYSPFGWSAQNDKKEEGVIKT